MRSQNRNWGVSIGAALGALMVHMLCLAPFVLTGAGPKRPPLPDQPGGGASASSPSAQPVEAMTLINLLNTESSDEPPLEEIASLGIELPDATLLIATPEPAPLLFEEERTEESETTEAAGDTQGHAAMFGRYLGQITARIERAWKRPRSVLHAPRFSCQTKIEQDERGKVLTVELRHCNPDVRWQQSLVSAIEHASPLPAPPVPSVFARTLVLSFSAEFWEEGVSNAQLYEPEIRLAHPGDTQPSQVITNKDKTLADVASHEGPVELRIEGNTVRWTLHDSAQPGGELRREAPEKGEQRVREDQEQ
jgi:hypothetical protein